ncbi:MAG: hypothetical protein WCF84_08650 [Anaerolineae bacterium]
MVKNLRIIWCALIVGAWLALIPATALADPCTERAAAIIQGRVPGTEEDPDCDRGSVVGAVLAWTATAATAVTAVTIGLGGMGSGGAPMTTAAATGPGSTSSGAPTSAAATPGPGSTSSSTPATPAEPITAILSGQHALQTLQGMGFVDCTTLPDGTLVNCRPRPGFDGMTGGKPVDHVVGQAIDPATGNTTHIMTQTTTELNGIAFTLNSNGTLDPNIAIVVTRTPPTDFLPVTPPSTATPPSTTPPPTTTPTSPAPPATSGGAPPPVPGAGQPADGSGTGPGAGGDGKPQPPEKPLVGGTPPVQPPVQPPQPPPQPPPPSPQAPPAPPPDKTQAPTSDSGKQPTPTQPNRIPSQVVDWAETEGKKIFGQLTPEEQKAMLLTAGSIAGGSPDNPVTFNNVDDVARYGRQRANELSLPEARQRYQDVQNMLHTVSLARSVYSTLSLLPGIDQKINDLLAKTARQMKLPPDAVKTVLDMSDENWEKFEQLSQDLANQMGVNK